MANFIPQTDVDNYGRELIDLTQRAAAEVVAPQLAQIHEDNAMLRQRLAQEARHRLDSQVAAAGQAAQQQPSRRMPMWSPDRRIYSRADIAKLYRQHAQGAYNGREAEWQRLESDIIAAGRDGRVQDTLPIGVK
jgi:exonuclease VII large subunit